MFSITDNIYVLRWSQLLLKSPYTYTICFFIFYMKSDPQNEWWLLIVQVVKIICASNSMNGFMSVGFVRILNSGTMISDNDHVCVDVLGGAWVLGAFHLIRFGSYSHCWMIRTQIADASSVFQLYLFCYLPLGRCSF